MQNEHYHRPRDDGFNVADLMPMRTHQEVAQILTERGEPITKGGVFMAEQSALKKLREALLSEAVARGWM